MLFTEWPLQARAVQAAKAGFEGVEVQFPYELPIDVWQSALQAAGTDLVLHNLPAGDWSAGDRGLACQPGRRDAFRKSVDEALAYATALGVRQLNCLAGIRPADVSVDQARDTLLDNLQYAARALRLHGITLLLEPINTFDVPGFFVNRPSQALALLEDLNADNVLLQYDVYHAQRMEGELAGQLQRNLARIGHIQIADNPGRHEPGTGEIAFRFLFQLLDTLGYNGWVGAEYHPATVTLAGLGWLSDRRSHQLTELRSV